MRPVDPTTKVELLISDPFELGGKRLLASTVASGEAPDAEGKLSILLRFDQAVPGRGYLWEYAVARPNRSSHDLSKLLDGEAVDAYLTCISNERAEGATPLDLSWWRGGFGMRGTLSKL